MLGVFSVNIQGGGFQDILYDPERVMMVRIADL
ncbi:MAG: hypothetical protein RI964_2094 [Pseudomonadota bacterium]|jgi:hypothetical protein